jgi:hypothetical protein
MTTATLTSPDVAPVVPIEGGHDGAEAAADRHFRRTWLFFALAVAVLSPLLIRFAAAGTPREHLVLGLAVVFAGALPAVWQAARRAPELPVFPIIMLIYGIGYGLPVFTTDPELWLPTVRMYPLAADSFVTEALRYSLAGIISLQAGFALTRLVGRRAAGGRVRLELDERRAQALLSGLGFFAVLLSWAIVTGRFAVMAQLGALIGVMRSLSWLAVAVLYSYQLQGRLHRWGLLALIGILGGETLTGISSGNLSAMLFPWIVVSAVYWRHRRRLPMRYVLAGLAFFVLLQPVKEEMRYWTWHHGSAQSSALERSTLWFDIAKNRWTQIAAGGSGSVEFVARHALARGNYLHMFAHTASYTPDVVGYWKGSTYGYLLVAFVPRAIWPDKPMAQQANDDYAIAYNLIPLEFVGRTMTGLPHLIEAFINFGVAGVFFIMMLLGVAYGVIDRAFNHREAGEGGAAIYAVLLIPLVSIESATAGLFGGLVQTTLVLYGLLWLIAGRRAAPDRGEL